jgi:Imm-5 like putative immunity protein
MNKPIKKTQLTTTLALLKQHNACFSGYKTLRASLPAQYPEDKPISLLHILKSNGVKDMMWALRATKQDNPKVRVAICADMAARVLKHYEARYPDDKRPRDCIKACRQFVRGKITLETLQKAAADAAYAAYAADAAAYAADAAAYAADAAYAAADAAYAAYAAYAAERKAQERIIRKYLR